MSKKSTKLLCIALAVILLFYGAYSVYIKVIENIDTFYAVADTGYDAVETDCFIVRDECEEKNGINISIIKDSADAVYIPYVSDGSRVASGDTIALRFNNEDDARAYKQRQALEERLQYYEKLKTQSVLSFFDIDKLENTVNEDIISILTSVEKNDFASVEGILSSVKYNASSMQTAMGEKLDFSDKIDELKSSIAAVPSGYKNYKKITAPFPGCYISSVDGYESIKDYNSIDKLDVNKIKGLLSCEPSKKDNSVIGKLVSEYNWYAVCLIPQKLTGDIKKGATLKACFENTGISELEMKVERITPASDGMTGIVLSCNEMNSEIATLRKEKMKLILKEYTGLRIPGEAVRNNNGQFGVFVLHGQIVKYKPIEVLYYADDYVIIKRGNDSSGESDNMRLYDTVITKGRNLYDGKIIY